MSNELMNLFSRVQLIRLFQLASHHLHNTEQTQQYDEKKDPINHTSYRYRYCIYIYKIKLIKKQKCGVKCVCVCIYASVA